MKTLKPLILIAGLLLLFNNINAQTCLFDKNYPGGEPNISVAKALLRNDSSYIMHKLLILEDLNAPPPRLRTTKISLYKLSACGNILWNKVVDSITSTSSSLSVDGSALLDNNDFVYLKTLYTSSQTLSTLVFSDPSGNTMWTTEVRNTGASNIKKYNEIVRTDINRLMLTADSAGWLVVSFHDLTGNLINSSRYLYDSVDYAYSGAWGRNMVAVSDPDNIHIARPLYDSNAVILFHITGAGILMDKKIIKSPSPPSFSFNHNGSKVILYAKTPTNLYMAHYNLQALKIKDTLINLSSADNRIGDFVTGSLLNDRILAHYSNSAMGMTMQDIRTSHFRVFDDNFNICDKDSNFDATGPYKSYYTSLAVSSGSYLTAFGVFAYGGGIPPYPRYVYAKKMKFNAYGILASSLQISGPSELNTQDPVQYSATITPFNATIKTVSWSTSDSLIATVDHNGFVSARKNGFVFIIARSDDHSGVTGTLAVTVRLPRLEVLSADSLVCSGSTLQIKIHISGLYNNGNIFTVQLSDASGNFPGKGSIASFTIDTVSVVSCALPQNIAPETGTQYRIRLISSNPVALSDHRNVRFREIDTPPVLALASNIISCVNIDTGRVFTWYRNGTQIPDENRYRLTVFKDGVYQSTINHPASGCRAFSDTLTIYKRLLLVSQNQSVCTGASTDIWFVKTWDDNNLTYLAELSDENGSFASPLTVGMITADNPQSITCNFPTGLLTGNTYHYKLRINCINRNIQSEELELHFLEAYPKPTIFSSGDTLVAQSSHNPSRYYWYRNQIELPDSTDTLIVSVAGAYQAGIRHSSGCISTSLPHQHGVEQININHPGFNTCKGALIAIPIEATTIFGTGNVMSIYLSDTLGSFTNGVLVGSVAGRKSTDTLICTLPLNVSSATQSSYMLRVQSNDPLLTSNSVGVTFKAFSPKPVIVQIGQSLIASNTDTTLTHHWYFEGNLIWQGGHRYTPTQNGTYKVIAISTSDCDVFSDEFIYLNTGIDQKSVNRFNIFPNPGPGLFTLQFEHEPGLGSVTVTDAQGSLVHTYDISRNAVEIPIDLTDAKSGMYILTITTESTITQHKKIMIMR